MKQHASFLAIAAVVMLACTNAYAKDKTGEIDKIFSWAKGQEAELWTRPFSRQLPG